MVEVFGKEPAGGLLSRRLISKKPGKDFSKKVLNAHRRIYKALLQRNSQVVREEMVKHVCEVEKDLVTLQKKRTKENFGKRLS